MCMHVYTYVQHTCFSWHTCTCSTPRKFSSPFIVQLIGIVSQVEDTSPMVLMEYMANRDLKHYLKSARPARVSKY